jgi:hypothetical protein
MRGVPFPLSDQWMADFREGTFLGKPRTPDSLPLALADSGATLPGAIPCRVICRVCRVLRHTRQSPMMAI